MCENPVLIAQKKQKFQQLLEETGNIRNFAFVDCWLKFLQEVTDFRFHWRGKHFYVKVENVWRSQM